MSVHDVETPAVYLVTPNDADATVALSFLRDGGIDARAFASLGQLCTKPADDIGCAVVVEEALIEPELDEFLRLLAAQPPWSDLPLVLVASQGSALGPLVERVFPESGNVAVLERPLNPVSLVSAARVGLRSRLRQLEVRDLLEERTAAVRLRDEFLAMLAHELRNPLAPIRNSVYIMKQLDVPDATFTRTRDIIERQVTHMARLVDDLLDVSRLELRKVQLQMQDLDLNAAIASATEACLPVTTARGHKMEVRLASEPLVIRADPVRIEQIVGNLVTNAAKFTPQGGSIAVEASSEGESAAVTVRDSGIGIRPHMLASVFDLFTQDPTSLARADGGLGIGLTIVKRLVELHGGTISVASEGVGRGSRFTVRFPKIRAQPAAGIATAAASASSARMRILVIEDNADVRESLGMLLKLWGHGVDFAETGPDGLDRARRALPDVALIDIGLPGLTGYEVARKIRSSDGAWAKKVKLVALTGYGRDSDREQALQCGFDCHLVKPIDPDVLARTLQAH